MPSKKADCGRHPARYALRLGVLDGGNQQAPLRSSDHGARREPQQRLLHELAHSALQKEHERRAEDGPQKRTVKAMVMARFDSFVAPRILLCAFPTMLRSGFRWVNADQSSTMSKRRFARRRQGRQESLRWLSLSLFALARCHSVGEQPNSRRNASSNEDARA